MTAEGCGILKTRNKGRPEDCCNSRSESLQTGSMLVMAAASPTFSTMIASAWTLPLDSLLQLDLDDSRSPFVLVTRSSPVFRIFFVGGCREQGTYLGKFALQSFILAGHLRCFGDECTPVDVLILFDCLDLVPAGLI